jgi:hypothetical protein
MTNMQVTTWLDVKSVIEMRTSGGNRVTTCPTTAPSSLNPAVLGGDFVFGF